MTRLYMLRNVTKLHGGFFFNLFKVMQCFGI